MALLILPRLMVGPRTCQQRQRQALSQTYSPQHQVRGLGHAPV